jgi:peptide/nickel transport system substrate-binding protein
VKNKIFLALISLIIALSVVLVACAQTATTAPAPAATTSAPTKANWWDKFGEPQYGGTITVRTTAIAGNFDPYQAQAGAWMFMYETLFFPSWTVDRNIWSFKPGFTPADYRVGLLVKDWDLGDTSTITLHLRQGIHWQNKAPVNGREFTSADVKNHYDRIMGVGEYTKPSAYLAQNIANIDSVTAPDNYTIVFKFKKPGLSNFLNIADLNAFNYIESPEADKLEPEGLKEWKNATGTGPWLLTDYVASTSMEYSKNSNYWSDDERHPNNQIPYVDTLKILVMNDTPTALAALRTGKVDFVQGVGWQDAKSMASTNPEITQIQTPTNGMSVLFRCDHAPFTDIRVRKAMQLAVNLKEIAQGYYKGTVDGTPAGLISPELKGYAYPYSEWSQDLKDEYSYNPTKAKELLAEAGYPNGFKTNVVTANAGPRTDLQLLQVIKSYFADIGVDMDIQTMDQATLASFVSAGKHDQLLFTDDTAYVFPPDGVIIKRYTKNPMNYTYNNDPDYDTIVNKFNVTTSAAEAAQLVQQADKYALEKHWAVNTFSMVSYNLLQPDIKGYSGEQLGYVGAWGQGQILARLWRTQSAK